MKNTFGNHLQITLFGESHGPYIGAVLDGLAPGIKVDEDYIHHQLSLRRPSGKISTARVEKDPFQIISGVYQGKTTGTPLTIIIPNKEQKGEDYLTMERIARPGHADYTAYCKYHGFEDYHGGGHFSGRITAALVAAGAIVLTALKEKNILIGSHIASLGGIKDREFENEKEDIQSLNQKTFAVLDDTAAEKMMDIALEAAEQGDSVGGVLESCILGLEAGLGEPWFDTMEGMLAHALFSIPALKGVSFGDAFSMVDQRGSEYNDAFGIKEGNIVTLTNHNGGINGGITNGMPITFRCAVKPTPSIYKEQNSVDFINKKEHTLKIEGRHDPAIIHRARVVVDSMAAIVIYDMMAGRYGTDYFMGENE
ncbi:MAG: chorismate synthase [Lachnospiraceae bacterium]|nr:chorismate synthase [Lachnospiraceae bacterium]